MFPRRYSVDGGSPTAEDAMATRIQQWICDGADTITKAIAEDNAGRFSSARALYFEGMQSLMMAAEYTADRTTRDSLTARIESYMERAKVLATVADESPSRSSATPQFDEFYQQGDFRLNQARTEESKGNALQAQELYTSAAEWFLKCFASDGNEVQKKTAQAGAEEAISRGEVLKKRFDRTSAPPSVGGAGAATPATTPATFGAAASPLTSPLASPIPPRTPGMPTSTPSGYASTSTGTPASSPAPAPAAMHAPSSVPRHSGPLAPGPPPVYLTDAEKAVLRNTSFVNGKLYVPFLGDDETEKFAFPRPFVDPDGLLGLSAKQQARFGGWKRPSEFMSKPTMINLVSAFSIKQDIVTDCSFVASLCISAAHERKMKKQLITSIIYPQDRFGNPVYNPSGKYMVKLHMNGVKRKVIVDDLLPVDKSGRLMCSYSTNPNELWVSIIEKAYLKVHGGYDFPGSNSGIDLFALTGWIPESMRTTAEDFNPDRTWERLVSGSRYGDCLITIATGPLTDAEEDRYGLVSTHAYALLDAREVNGLRLIQLKNPWSHKRWRGAFSEADATNWTPELRAALHFDQITAMQVDNGIFWIDYASMLRHFHSIHFNWNPELFQYRQVTHGAWPIAAPGPKNDRFTVGDNPQFRLSVQVPPPRAGRAAGASVWLLLTRHVTEKEVDDEEEDSGRALAARSAANGESIADTPTKDYLALHIYKKSGMSPAGERVYYFGDSWLRGAYMNNPHVLVRFDLDTVGTHTFTLVVSQYERWRDIYYSLDALCMAPIQLSPVPERFPHRVQAMAEWTADSAGGHAGRRGFYDNPQLKVSLLRDADVFVSLRSVPKLALNLRLYASGGERVFGPGVAEVGNSGDYRNSFCYFIASKVPAGEYTLVASTYDAGCLEKCIVTVGASTCLPGIAHHSVTGGYDCKIVAGEWSFADGTAAGCSDHNNYLGNPRYMLTVPDGGVQVFFKIQADREPPVHLNLSAFQCSPTGEIIGSQAPARAYASTNNGVYENPIYGSLSRKKAFERGLYLLVPSTYAPAAARFTFRVYSTAPVSIVRR